MKTLTIELGCYSSELCVGNIVWMYLHQNIYWCIDWPFEGIFPTKPWVYKSNHQIIRWDRLSAYICHADRCLSVSGKGSKPNHLNCYILLDLVASCYFHIKFCIFLCKTDLCTFNGTGWRVKVCTIVLWNNLTLIHMFIFYISVFLLLYGLVSHTRLYIPPPPGPVKISYNGCQRQP